MAVSMIWKDAGLDLVTETIRTATYNLVANASGTIDADVTKAGYKVIGIVGFSSNGTGVLVREAYMYQENTARMALKNTSSTTQSRQGFVTILYRKA